MKKYMFALNKRNLALIVMGILLNMVGYSITTNYSWPLYMDSLGTFFVAILLGPLAGSICGIALNIMIIPDISFGWIYFIVSISGAIIVGMSLYGNERLDSFRVVSTSVLTGIVMTIIATPINLMFQDGMTGNIWGNALVEMLSEYTSLKVFCCIAGELIVNIPDKMVSLIIMTGIIKFFRSYGIRFIPPEEYSEKSKRDSIKGLLLVIAIAEATAIMSVNVGTVKAEENHDFASDYMYTVYGNESGLSSLEINCIVQTNDGYIWVGSYSGIYRYNGQEFEKISLDSKITNALSMYCDKKGRLWIGTNDSGVACYDLYSHDIIFFSAQDGLCADSVRSICEDMEGNIYLGTTSYMCKLELPNNMEISDEAYKDNAKVKVFNDLQEITYTYDMVVTEKNSVCGITERGVLFEISNDELVHKRECDFEGAMYSSLAFSGRTNFLVGTSSNYMEFIHLSDKGFEKMGSVTTQDMYSVYSVLYVEDFQGYFVAFGNGLGFVSTKRKVQNLTIEDFNTGLSDVLLDKQSNIWMTSTKNGVLKLSKNSFTNIYEKIGHVSGAVNSIEIDDGSNYALVATDEGAFKVNLKAYAMNIDNSLKLLDGERVRHIMRDSEGNIWASTYGRLGLYKIRADGTARPFTSGNSGILGSRFRYTLELSDGRILAISGDGLNFIKGDTVVKTLGIDDGFTISRALCAYETEEGTILVGTDGDGVYVIENDEVVGHYGVADGLTSQVVMKIVGCDDGYLYVSSNGIYYHQIRQHIRRLENFPYTNNYDVYINDDNRAFISSSAGIYVVDEDDLLNDSTNYKYTLLNKKRGFTTTLTANSWNDIYGNKLLLCCSEGIMALDMDSYEEFDTHYQIVLQSVCKDDEIIEYTNGIYNIPAGGGQVQITPAILNYTASNPYVSVQLEGIDSKPRYFRQNEIETIYYASIPFGDYNLKVCVLDDSGTIVNKEKTFLLHKDAKLYERTYYKVYLIVDLSILILFIAWIVAKMGNMAVINNQYDQIREAKEEAENANQAKSRFLAQMSHEIRTPINAVLGMDEMILRESSEPTIRGYASDINKAGHTLLALINDILDSSKIESGKMEIVPVEYELETVIHDLVNMISQRAQSKDLKLEVEVQPDLPSKLYGDDVRIKQVITNMLTNAVKYTMVGTVWLRFSGSKMDDNLILHVEVEDTGIGIKQEDLPKLFDAYQRIEENKNRTIEGTGLGMNITIQLLHLMGSHLDVNSIYGHGSKFFFDLDQKIIDDNPIGIFEPDAHVEQTVAGMPDNAFTAAEAKVLVVDDNAMNRKVFKSILKHTKIQITEAASGVESISKAEKEVFDVIFMDHMMPGMDGVEAMKVLKTLYTCKDVPIYVLTANATAGVKDEYLAMGFDGFLAKPIEIGKLEEVLLQEIPKDKIKPMTEEEWEEAKGSASSNSNQPPEDLPDVEGLDWNYAWLHLPEEGMLREGVISFYDIIDLQADRLQKFYEMIIQSEKDPYIMNIDADSFTLEKEKNNLDKALDEYRIQVHGMKSAAAIIGIVPLAGMAKILEFAAKKFDITIITSMHDTFINEWRSYKNKLNGVFGLGLNEVSINGVDERPNGDIEILKVMFEMLRPAVEDLDVDTADGIMDKMKGYTFGSEINELVDKLNSAVKDFDEELAGQLMDQMLEIANNSLADN